MSNIGILKKYKWQELKVISESEGHLLIIQCLVFGMKWTFTGVYAPQVGKTEFLKSLIKKLEQIETGNLVILADFNAVMNEELDKFSKSSSQSVLPHVFTEWLQDRGIVDV